MIGVVEHPEPLLQIFNFKTASSDLIDIEDASYDCSLEWPSLQMWAVPLAMSVRSDPAPGWQPNPELKVPFYTSRNDRLFAVTLWVAEGANINTLVLFIPNSTISSRLRLSTAHKKEFSWDEWGPHGSRMLVAPSGHSMIWVCYIFGQSFISPRRTEEDNTTPVGPKAIQILDFDQLAVRKDVAEGRASGHPVTKTVRGTTVLDKPEILLRPVLTDLPYREKTIRVPTHCDHAFNAVMLSEDSIVTVTSVCLRV